jgi:hypothetical protein
MVYLITHGDTFDGVDPGHTMLGFVQINALKLPDCITLIVAGTGKRFLEVLKVVHNKMLDVPVKYSPFCGGPECSDDPDNVVLPTGLIISRREYIGISNKSTIMWEFVQTLSNESLNVLLCAGSELARALGVKFKQGQLYTLDPTAQTGREID